MANFVVYTDGGARGNPGPAGIGVVIEVKIGDKSTENTYSKYIGEATNNVAEYSAFLLALEKLQQLKATGSDEIAFYLDSQLVVEQLKGNYKVKNQGLAPLYQKAVSELGSYSKVAITYIPRERNKKADKLVNQAIDDGLFKSSK